MQDRAQSLWEAWHERRDGAAFASLVEPEISRALCLARSLGCGPEDAEDAVQEALTRLASERSAEPARVGVRAWFYRAVRDRARTQSRSGWRRRGREKVAARPEEAPPAPDRLEVREQVEKALAELDPDDREAVRLRHLQDLDYAEMGIVLGVSEGACRVRVHRALERLKARFGEGAAAIVASLPLPVSGKGAAMVKGAIAVGTGATGAATVAATGGVIVASTGKIVAAAAAVLAIGIVGAVAVSTLGSGSEPKGAGGTTVARVEKPAKVKSWDETSAKPDKPTVAEGPSGPVANPRPASPLKKDAPAGGGGVESGGGGRGGGSTAKAPSGPNSGPSVETNPAQGGVGLVDQFRAAPADPGDFLWDYRRVRAVVKTGEGEVRRFDSTGETTAANLQELSDKSAVIEFGPGSFVFEGGKGTNGEWHVPGKDIRSLEIRGAGMDRTTLSGKGLWEFLCIQKGIENLYVHDFTFDGGPERTAFIDIREKGTASVIVEGVRFRNIPNAGNAAPLAAGGTTFLGVRGCEFEGSGLPWGAAMGLRGSALALFQECRFTQLQAAVHGTGSTEDAAAVNLLDCVFDGTPVVLSSPGKRSDGKPNLTVRVRGGQVLLGPPNGDSKKVREAWGESSIAEATNVTFSPGKPAFTLGEMLAALDRLSLPSGQVVAGIQVHPADDGGPPAWVVLAMETTEAGRKEHHYLLPAGEGPPEDLPRKFHALQAPTAEQMEGALPLAQVLRQSGLSPEAGATEASFLMNLRLEGVVVPCVYFRSQRGWPDARLNGKTGENLGTAR